MTQDSQGSLLFMITYLFLNKLTFFFFFWLCWVFIVAHEFSYPVPCGILVSRPGIEPMSPALEGGFLTAGPPGKSPKVLFLLEG